MKKICLLIVVLCAAIAMNAATTSFTLPVVLWRGFVVPCSAFVSDDELHLVGLFGAEKDLVYSLSDDGTITNSTVGDVAAAGFDFLEKNIEHIRFYGNEYVSYNPTINRVTDHVYFSETEEEYDFYFEWPKYTDYSKAGKEFAYDGINYKVTTENTCTTMYGIRSHLDDVDVKCNNTDEMGDIVIPDTVYDEAGNTYTVTAIGEFSFTGCQDLKSIEIPESVTSINYGAFFDCNSVTKIVIPETVVEIGGSAFNDCTLLHDIKLPDAITKLSRRLFYRCRALESINIPKNLTMIEEHAVHACSALSCDLILPETLTTIETWAFGECPNLTGKVPIPSSVKEIGYAAFAYDTGFTSLELPDSLTTIDDFAFFHCEGLSGELVIPESVTDIGIGAFCDCGFTGELVIPSSLDRVADFAFQQCGGITKVSLPNTITEIGFDAFSTCTGLTDFIVPNSVKFIGLEAFESCTAISEFTIEDGDTELEFEDDTVFDKDNIKKLYLGRNVTNSVFNKLATLKNVEFGEKVTSIPANTFDTCDALRTVVSRSVTPPATENAFAADTYTNGVLYVPQSAIADYAAAAVWKDFCNLQPLEKYDSVDLTDADTEQVKVYAENGAICLEGNVPMTITTMSGATLYSGVGSTRVNVIPGIYLVTTPADTTKIYIKE